MNIAYDTVKGASIFTITAMADFNQKIKDDAVVRKMSAYEESVAFKAMDEEDKLDFIFEKVANCFDIPFAILKECRGGTHGKLYPKMIACFLSMTHCRLSSSTIGALTNMNDSTLRINRLHIQSFLNGVRRMDVFETWWRAWIMKAPKYLM
jgi:hypothetical protein